MKKEKVTSPFIADIILEKIPDYETLKEGVKGCVETITGKQAQDEVIDEHLNRFEQHPSTATFFYFLLYCGSQITKENLEDPNFKNTLISNPDFDEADTQSFLIGWYTRKFWEKTNDSKTTAKDAYEYVLNLLTILRQNLGNEQLTSYGVTGAQVLYGSLIEILKLINVVAEKEIPSGPVPAQPASPS